MRAAILGVVAGAIFACILLLAYDAWAQGTPMICGDGEDIRQALTQRHQEQVTDEGISARGGLVQLYKSEGGATWTLTLTLPGGPTCLLGAGQNWTRHAPVEPQPRTSTH